VWADKIKKTEDIVKYQVQATLTSRKFLCFRQDNPYLLIERARRANLNEYVRVEKSNVMFDDTNPWWDTKQTTMTEFCNNDKYLPIRLSVYSFSNSGNNQMYGQVTTTTRDIEMLPSENRILQIKNEKGLVTGHLEFKQFEMDMRPSLLEYIQSGWEIQVSIGIDFTLSNLEITDYRSLHK
jgi:hypothetical protein